MKRLLILAAWLLPTLTSAQDNADVNELRQQVEQLRKDNTRLSNTNKELQQRIDTLEERVSVMGRVPDFIYAQCLRFPLTEKYDKALIDEAIRCVDNLTYWNNTRWGEYSKVRRQLLDKYKGYNDEILAFLKKFRESLEKRNWDMGPMLRMEAKNEAGKLSYISVYNNGSDKSKNGKSIEYLDGILNRFFKLADIDGVISQKVYDELINDVTL
jgi:DNA-binding ferritin-like protein